jgi:hypothetical protein
MRTFGSSRKRVPEIGATWLINVQITSRLNLPRTSWRRYAVATIYRRRALGSRSPQLHSPTCKLSSFPIPKTHASKLSSKASGRRTSHSSDQGHRIEAHPSPGRPAGTATVCVVRWSPVLFLVSAHITDYAGSKSETSLWRVTVVHRTPGFKGSSTQ